MLYTRTGDNGTTSLFGGKRILKSDPLIEACGSIDELSSFMGIAIHVTRNTKHIILMTNVQKDLQKIMSYISGAKVNVDFLKDKVNMIEKEINSLQKNLPEIHKFILPQGTELSCWFHILRTVCRRAERNIVKLKNREAYSHIIQYFNRLSDLFFVLARKYNKKEIGI